MGLFSKSTPRTTAGILADVLSSDKGIEELKAFFNSIDTSQDGFLSEDEWFAAVDDNLKTFRSIFGKDVGVSTLKAMFIKFDQNDDGQLSWEEFEQGCKIFLLSALFGDNYQQALTSLLAALPKPNDPEKQVEAVSEKTPEELHDPMRA